jgi:hypothetical protein
VTDRRGKATPLTLLARFTIDTKRPSNPRISSAPGSSTSQTTATFALADTEAGVTFRCALDGAAASSCTTPKQYANLGLGGHHFTVVAVDRAQNASTATTYAWTVIAPTALGIGGRVVGNLAPGVAQPVDLWFSNPNDAAVRVTSVTITIEDATTRDGVANPACIGSANVVMGAGLGAPVTVPPHTSATLTQLGISQASWPTVQMLDLPVNQDGCQATAFTLDYAGAATQA